MQISKLYSNLKDKFHDIVFNIDGLNIVYAEITDPENYNKDTHNLGKSTLIELIDFMLLKKRSKESFLFKHSNLFKDFEFFLELSLSGGAKYLTIKRSVKSNTKISLLLHEERQQDFSAEVMDIWTHSDVPLAKAKALLDAYLSFEPIKPWTFRVGLPYFLRSQYDYQDVFQLNRFKGQHKDWKPYLFQILGFDGNLMKRTYDIDDEVSEVESQIRIVRREFPGSIDSIDKLNGKILLVDNEIRDLETSLDTLSFKEIDDRITDDLVSKIETSVSALNEIRYSLSLEAETIKNQLSLDCVEDIQKTRKIFEEASFYFSEQLLKDYNSLIDFNRRITIDRKKFLTIRLHQIMDELIEVDKDLSKYNEERQRALSILMETKTGRRFKDYQKSLVNLKTQRELLEKMKDITEKLEFLENQIKELQRERNIATVNIENEIKRGNNTYNNIRTAFSKSVKEVLGEEAIISITPNKANNFEFEAEIVNTGKITSQSKGTSYKQVLCAMFDLSILKVYADKPFFKFVYHDGILEGLDDRKKIQLLNHARKVCQNYNLQYILSVIDSDWPMELPNSKYPLIDGEIIVNLSDIGSTGRLFKIDVF